MQSRGKLYAFDRSKKSLYDYKHTRIHEIRIRIKGSENKRLFNFSIEKTRYNKVNKGKRPYYAFKIYFLQSWDLFILQND